MTHDDDDADVELGEGVDVTDDGVGDLLVAVGLDDDERGDGGGPARIVIEPTDAEVRQLLGLVKMVTGLFWSMTLARVARGKLDDEIVESFATLTDDELVMLEAFAPAAVPTFRRIVSATDSPWPFVAAFGFVQVSRFLLLRRLLGSGEMTNVEPQGSAPSASASEAGTTPTQAQAVKLDPGEV